MKLERVGAWLILKASMPLSYFCSQGLIGPGNRPVTCTVPAIPWASVGGRPRQES